MVYPSNWHESQFLSLVNSKLESLAWWSLDDGDAAKTRTQKNWLPFFDGCRLMLSKRFAPVHAVGEFNANNIKVGSTVFVKDLPLPTQPLTPATITGLYFVRGSAPIIAHPLFPSSIGIGCVHVRGRHKVYRHALYLAQTVAPYAILSFSGLFAFSPFRNIEFVMSMFVTESGQLQLTHGSSDCESRLAIVPDSLLRQEFGGYLANLQ